MNHPDPRPHTAVVDGDVCVIGKRCTACRYPSARYVPRCPVCRSDVHDDHFGPRGVVFASTVLRVSVLDRKPPVALAYLDLLDGPRVLVHSSSDHPLPVGSPAKLVAGDADLWAEPVDGVIV